MMMKIKYKLLLRSFFLSFAAFAAIAAIIITKAYMNKLAFEPLDKGSTVLIGVLNESDEVISLALLNTDPSSGRLTFCRIEDNTVISDGVLLQNMYDKSDCRQLLHTVKQLVGTRVDRYIMLSCDAVAALTDAVSELDHLVPYRFEYGGESYSGNCIMNGELARAMLTYSGYDSKNVSMAEIGCSYLKSYLARCSELTGAEALLSTAEELVSLAEIETNMSSAEIADYCSALVQYPATSYRNVTISGYKQATSSNIFFIPDSLTSRVNIFK